MLTLCGLCALLGVSRMSEETALLFYKGLGGFFLSCFCSCLFCFPLKIKEFSFYKDPFILNQALNRGVTTHGTGDRYHTGAQLGLKALLGFVSRGSRDSWGHGQERCQRLNLM